MFINNNNIVTNNKLGMVYNQNSQANAPPAQASQVVMKSTAKPSSSLPKMLAAQPAKKGCRSCGS